MKGKQERPCREPDLDVIICSAQVLGPNKPTVADRHNSDAVEGTSLLPIDSCPLYASLMKSRETLVYVWNSACRPGSTNHY